MAARAIKNPGERKTLDITAIDLHPPQYLSEEPIMGLPAYHTTLILRFKELGGTRESESAKAAAAAMDKAIELAESLRSDSASEPISLAELLGHTASDHDTGTQRSPMGSPMGSPAASVTGSGSMSGSVFQQLLMGDGNSVATGPMATARTGRTARSGATSMYGGRSVGSGVVHMVSHTASGGASLASKYGVESMGDSVSSTLDRRTRSSFALSRASRPSMASITGGLEAALMGLSMKGDEEEGEDGEELSEEEAIKARELSLKAVMAKVYGVTQVRKFWQRNFCYLVFDTESEALFALQTVHRMIAAHDRELKGMVINCFFI